MIKLFFLIIIQNFSLITLRNIKLLKWTKTNKDVRFHTAYTCITKVTSTENMHNNKQLNITT